MPESTHRQSALASPAPRRSVGCMAGLLRLLSPYHRSHHRKRLTAKNAAPAVASTPPPSPPPAKKNSVATESSPSPADQAQQQPAPSAVRRRRSCETPRSPTIASEHRRASCDSPRQPPPAIVARLMGLEESAPPSPAATPRPVLPTRPPPPPPETATEKRRKLLGALEKCDEDLKTLRRIIAAVRAVEMRAAAADVVPAPAGEGKGDKWKDVHDEPSPSPSLSPSPTLRQQHKPRVEQQHPSPDSVLDAISSPRFPCRKRSSPCTDLDAHTKPSTAVGSKIVKPSRTLVFSGEYCKIKPCSELQAIATYHHHHHPVVAIEGIPRWMMPPPSAESESWWHGRRWDLGAAGRSRAMAESVREVWGHGAGEERREAVLVGAALERDILHDLVSDVVAELLPGHGDNHLTGCRKRLCF